MALSDEDRAAIRLVREFLEQDGPLGDRDKWERVLKLAGEEPLEPDAGTFWLDPDDHDVYLRDDRATLDFNDLHRWWCTAVEEKFTWIEVFRRAPKLVELVRADEASVPLQAALRDLRVRAEAMHVKLHGPNPAISGCTSGPCYMMWRGLCDHGYRGGAAEGEEI